MIKKFVICAVAGILLSNCVFASDCEIIHKSVRFYEKQDLTNICSLYNLANEYYLNKKYQKALNTYKDIITLNPQEERAYIKRAEIYSECKNYENFHREYIRLVKNIPDSIEGNGMMYWFHKYITEDYDTALKYINKAIELTNGKNFLYFYDRGSIFEKMGKYEEAIADYTKYAQSDDEYNYDAYFDLSRCYKVLGDEAKGKEAMLKWDYEHQKNKNKNELTLAERVKLRYSDLNAKFHTYYLY